MNPSATTNWHKGQWSPSSLSPTWWVAWTRGWKENAANPINKRIAANWNTLFFWNRIMSYPLMSRKAYTPRNHLSIKKALPLRGLRTFSHRKDDAYLYLEKLPLPENFPARGQIRPDIVANATQKKARPRKNQEWELTSPDFLGQMIEAMTDAAKISNIAPSAMDVGTWKNDATSILTPISTRMSERP